MVSNDFDSSTEHSYHANHAAQDFTVASGSTSTQTSGGSDSESEQNVVPIVIRGPQQQQASSKPTVGVLGRLATRAKDAFTKVKSLWSGEAPAPEQEEDSPDGKPDEEAQTKANPPPAASDSLQKLYDAISAFSDLHNTSNPLGMVRKENAAIHSLGQALDTYMMDGEITPEIWKRATTAPTVWVMVALLESPAAYDSMHRIRKNIQETLDDKLAEPGFADKSNDEDTILLFDRLLSLKYVRLSPDQKDQFIALGAEWELLLWKRPHVVAHHDLTIKRYLHDLWMHPATVVCGSVFLHVEIISAVVLFIHLRSSTTFWSNCCAAIYGGGGFVVFLVMYVMYSSMKAQGAPSLPYLTWAWHLGVPVIPVFEIATAWYYCTAVQSPNDVVWKVEVFWVVLWDNRQVFHLARQLRSMFVSFPFALFILYVQAFKLESGSYDRDLLFTCVSISFANAGRSILSALWMLSISNNVTGWGMKKTLSHNPDPPSPAHVRFIFILLIYYFVFNMFVLSTSLQHHDCGDKVDIWLGVQGGLTIIVVVGFLLFNRSGEKDLLDSVTWLAAPVCLRTVQVALGYSFVYFDIAECMETKSYANAAIVIDNIIICFMGIGLVYLLVTRGCFCCKKEGENTDPDDEDQVTEGATISTPKPEDRE
eukprot:TRINITY_DN1917_c2_g1_i1.p1 TRINITY_DN1917_c2_g1~~TRINITY_DN1917_c2_g1_i1.p1  ORF type:complete len:650 (+),score=98.86 TRINITY_DN1917_c2_g1_i1:93-2042(+)